MGNTVATSRAKDISPEQQIAQLDARLGAGVGATKERARLLKQVEQRKANQTEDFLALAGVFFYLKFIRRRSLSPDYVQSPVIVETELNWLQWGRLTIDLNMERNYDIEGKAGDSIATLLIEFPYRFQLLGYLSDAQIRFVCSELDSLFEQQEFCAQCESWSHYDDTSPFEFAVYNATWMLWLLRNDDSSRSKELFKGRVRLPNHPGSYDEWQLPKISEAVLTERMQSLRHALLTTVEAGT